MSTSNPALHREKSSNTQKRIAGYLNRILSNPRSTEHRTVDNFVVCTKEGDEQSYKTIQRNVRQFMDGMRNFLMTQYGNTMLAMIPKKLPPATTAGGVPGVTYSAIEEDEISLESVIEATLQQHVVVPLYYHVYQRILQHFSK
jgi:hypothetical protein